MSKHLQIATSDLRVHLKNGRLSGDGVQDSRRRLKDLENVFDNEAARKQMDGDQVVYEVQAHFPVPAGTTGGLFFGTSTIYPGKVGQEYFMTKGHFHTLADRGEYYWCIQGEGVLILMDTNRKTWAERMSPGSLHYIGGHVAHRVANTSKKPLIFEACWPADAGHDYNSIAEKGFPARLLEVDGEPQLVENK